MDGEVLEHREPTGGDVCGTGAAGSHLQGECGLKGQRLVAVQEPLQEQLLWKGDPGGDLAPRTLR